METKHLTRTALQLSMAALAPTAFAADAMADKVEIDGSKDFSADLNANNGIMGSIGTVLVPKSLDGFAGLRK